VEKAMENVHTRRELIIVGGGAALAAWLGAQPTAALAQQQTEKSEQEAAEEKEKEEKESGEEAEVTPAEDLMREHGVLRRVLLIYDEAQLRLSAGREFPPDALAAAAGIVKQFIEEYHEKLEEDHLFPRFEKAGKLADLTKILREQHAAGRRITAAVLAGTQPGALKEEGERKKMAAVLWRFSRMYRPHAAREDTVLFPELRKILKEDEYEELGEKFEAIEHQRFGKEGFEKFVEQVAKLETRLGIHDLAKFTPTD
jgi:hemerythrin-like domain-containing protein